MKINEYFYHLQGRDDFVQKNHTHNEIELIQILSGEGTVLKSDKSYPLKKQFLYFIDARKPHIVHPINCEEYVRNKIVINADSFFSFFREAGLAETAETLLTGPPIPTEKVPQIEHLFKTVVQLCSSQNSTNAGFAHGYILEILHLASSLSASTKQPVESDTVIQKILDFIARKNGLTSLSELSTMLHMNKYYVCHLFKDKTGMTLSDYLAEKRFEKCSSLLTDSACSIEEISVLCGFSNASSLTRFFKKKSGLSPMEYRKSQK